MSDSSKLSKSSFSHIFRCILAREMSVDVAVIDEILKKIVFVAGLFGCTMFTPPFL